MSNEVMPIRFLGCGLRVMGRDDSLCAQVWCLDFRVGNIALFVHPLFP